MKQKQFEQEYAALWSEVQAILDGKSAQSEALPLLYRRLCQTLALSSQRGYSPALTNYLQKMVTDCHRRLYGAVAERPLVLREWLLQDFPQRVRQEWRLLVLAMLAFWGVALGLGVLVWLQPHWAYYFISPEQLNEFQAMYQPGNIRHGRGGSEGDIEMFGFYIWNNVSIGFRTFAAGIFGGIPTLVSLTFNGMHIGVVASWLSKDPATRDAFWSFVITHSSFEIIGLLLAAVAGMRLGLALLVPGRYSRRQSLLNASRHIFPVVVGASLLIVLAAFFEAFWSANASLPSYIKYVAGGLCWGLLILYLGWAGKGSR